MKMDYLLAGLMEKKLVLQTAWMKDMMSGNLSVKELVF